MLHVSNRTSEMYFSVKWVGKNWNSWKPHFNECAPPFPFRGSQVLLNGVGHFEVVRKVLKPLEKVLERPCVSEQYIDLNLVVVSLCVPTILIHHWIEEKLIWLYCQSSCILNIEFFLVPSPWVLLPTPEPSYQGCDIFLMISLPLPQAVGHRNPPRKHSSTGLLPAAVRPDWSRCPCTLAVHSPCGRTLWHAQMMLLNSECHVLMFPGLRAHCESLLALNMLYMYL